jgi:crotonobetainyl-CoA:carnitine CoA-transferase CaiB-like acyl-CoA transferase
MDILWPGAGMRIVDLGDGIAAAYAARLLADFGASVIKIECPDGGDSSRTFGPFPGDVPNPEASGMFLYLNAGKRSVSGDVESTEGAAIVGRILQTADVVIEDRGPGWFDRLPFPPESLEERLVVCSISAYGQDGPKAGKKASEIGVYASGGMMYITGDGSREPLVHGGSQAAHLSGVNAASACLAAHMLAKTTGRGQRIDISEQEVIATTIFPALNIYSHTGGVMKRAPSGIANLVNSSPMETNDGYIMPSYAGLGDFQALAAFLEVPELGDERFSTPERRAANAEEIDELAGPAFRSRSKQDIFHNGQEWRLTFTAVQDGKDLVDCPQLGARHFFAEQEHPIAGTVKTPGRVPADIGDARADQLGPAPTLGQHTRSVLEALGLATGDIGKLLDDGLIQL